MTKTNVILLVSFLLTFAAGGAVGLLVAKPAPAHRESWLTEQLNLSADQREQMRKIWSEVMGPTRRQQSSEQRAALAKQRDTAVSALLTDDQRTKYQAIEQEYTRGLDQISQERKKAFDQAIEQTKKILTPQQAAKYEALIARQRERGMGGPPEFRGSRDHRSTSDSTKPPADSPAPHSGG